MHAQPQYASLTYSCFVCSALVCHLKAGADPDVVDGGGISPLVLAGARGARALVLLMLPNSTPIPGVTPWSVDGVLAYSQRSQIGRSTEPTSDGRGPATTGRSASVGAHEPSARPQPAREEGDVPAAEDPDAIAAARLKQDGDQSFRFAAWVGQLLFL
jgi:hypothetical protein